MVDPTAQVNLVAPITPVAPTTPVAPITPVAPTTPVVAVAASPQHAATQSAKRSPLNILEELLDHAEAQKAENQVQTQHDAEVATLAAKEAELRRIDRQRIEAERAKMTEIDSSPEEIARQAQHQQKTAEEQQKATNQEGYEIVQLDHIKI